MTPPSPRRAPALREPAVAGSFYPRELRELQRWCQPPEVPAQPRRVVSALSPHAGYMYSGALARQVFAGIEVPERVLIMNPNHTGMGPGVSLYPPGAWKFPGFVVPVDEELAEHLFTGFARLIPGFTWDTLAHEQEHSGEVIVPFLYGRNPGVKIAVVTLKHLPLSFLSELAEALAEALPQELRDTLLLVASSDMTHYEPAEVAARLDAMLFPYLDTLEGERLYETVERHGLTMCGYIPATLNLFLSRRLGARRGMRVGYTHSGVVSGDFRSVVAYAGYWFF